MSRHNILRIVLPRILIALCLLELVSACGSSTYSTPGITPSTNPLSAQSSSLPRPSIEKARALDQAGLLHIQINPISCSSLAVSNAVVFASNRLEYDAGEIQQMTTYIGQILGRGEQQVGNFLYDDPPTPPATLNVALGGLIGTQQPSGTNQTNVGCSESLQITNIGNSTITITGVNMRLLSDTQLNQYHYRLIDSCSLAPAGGSDQLCPRLVGSSTAYYYNFNLGSAKAGTLFTGQRQIDQPFLDPGQIAFIFLSFLSSENLIYSVAPEITVAPGITISQVNNGQRTFTLSQLNSTLAFAKPDQYSCYKLNGKTFVKKDLSSGFCM